MTTRSTNMKRLGATTKDEIPAKKMEKSKDIPLHSAIKKGCIEIVKKLLNRGEESNSDPVSRNMAVHIAAANGKDEILSLLIKAGYPVDDLFDKRKPIHTAALCGHREILKILLEAGVDINTKVENLLTPMHFAAIAGRLAEAKFLLEFGSNLPDFPNRQYIPYVIDVVINKKQWTRKSAVKSYVEILKLLINYAPDDKLDSWLVPSINSAFKYKTPIELLDVLFEYNVNQCSDFQVESCKSSKHFIAAIDHIDDLEKLYCVLYNLTPLDLKPNKFIKDKEIESLVARFALLKPTSDDSKVLEGLIILLLQNLLHSHYALCHREIESMQNAKIVDNANITYYDILIKSIDQIANYFENEKLLSTLESEYTKFDAYALFLEQRIRKGKQRKKLIENASNRLFNIVRNNF